LREIDSWRESISIRALLRNMNHHLDSHSGMRPILDTLCRLLPRLLPIKTIIHLQHLGTLQHAIRALAVQTNWLLYSNEHVQMVRSVLDDTYIQERLPG
jgi:hypothetical protein